MARIAPKFPLTLTDSGKYDILDIAENVINQNIKNLLLTNPGEKLFDPNFGVGLRRYLFEFPNVSTNIRSDIIDQIREYIPFINVTSVNAKTIELGLEVSIKYRFRDSFVNYMIELRETSISEVTDFSDKDFEDEINDSLFPQVFGQN